jgi:hypothetical protein
MIYLSSYIQQWKLAVWDTCFFRNSNLRMGSKVVNHGSNSLKTKEAIQRVFYTNTPPKFLDRLNYELKSENSGRIMNWGMFPSS